MALMCSFDNKMKVLFLVLSSAAQVSAKSLIKPEGGAAGSWQLQAPSSTLYFPAFIPLLFCVKLWDSELVSSARRPPAPRSRFLLK